MFTPDYWNSIASSAKKNSRLDPWRNYMREVSLQLIARWLQGKAPEFALKTDLFEDATTAYPLVPSLSRMSNRLVGIDWSREVVTTAKARIGSGPVNWCDAVVCDARALPFKPGSFDLIICLSTLDHFCSKEDIYLSLRELAKALRPRGILIATFDNPENPIVNLRNRLPYRLLKWFRLIPFHVGATYSKSELCQATKEIGLTVTDTTAIIHSPRLFAIWIAKMVATTRSKIGEASLSRLFRSFESIERWRTRYLTGYFIAIRAVKN